tara:strand:- start:914 stop:1543 length:630 start_codon:yes stop_codon:yes gene_type:complete
MTTATRNGSSATTEVMVHPLEIGLLEIHIEGDSPLITHRFDEKAKKMMLDKMQKKAAKAREKRDPWMDFCRSLHWLGEMPRKPSKKAVKEGRYGFPSVGFKAAAINACSQLAGITKVAARGAFHIPGELVEIVGFPEMREDIVRIGMGTTDLRYRGEFKEWNATFVIRYNAGMMSEEQLVNLFNVAGFASGIGEWRPQKGGSNGMFHVA